MTYELACRLIALCCVVFAACIGLSILLGWISDNFTGKELDE